MKKKNLLIGALVLGTSGCATNLKNVEKFQVPMANTTINDNLKTMAINFDNVEEIKELESSRQIWVTYWDSDGENPYNMQRFYYAMPNLIAGTKYYIANSYTAVGFPKLVTYMAGMLEDYPKIILNINQEHSNAMEWSFTPSVDYPAGTTAFHFEDTRSQLSGKFRLYKEKELPPDTTSPKILGNNEIFNITNDVRNAYTEQEVLDFFYAEDDRDGRIALQVKYSNYPVCAVTQYECNTIGVYAVDNSGNRTDNIIRLVDVDYMPSIFGSTSDISISYKTTFNINDYKTFTATSWSGQDITNNIVYTHNVVNGAVGEHLITATITDKGYTATKTRKVFIGDWDKPYIVVDGTYFLNPKYVYNEYDFTMLAVQEGLISINPIVGESVFLNDGYSAVATTKGATGEVTLQVAYEDGHLEVVTFNFAVDGFKTNEPSGWDKFWASIWNDFVWPFLKACYNWALGGVFGKI